MDFSLNGDLQAEDWQEPVEDVLGEFPATGWRGLDDLMGSFQLHN